VVQLASTTVTYENNNNIFGLKQLIVKHRNTFRFLLYLINYIISDITFHERFKKNGVLWDAASFVVFRVYQHFGGICLFSF
jgi:hypothetical protein